MVAWKTSINPVFIHDHDVANRICAYDTVTGAYEIKTNIELGIKTISDCWIGFSKQNGSDTLGIFASNIGPIFFINEKMYSLKNNEWDFLVKVIDKELNQFSFVFNEKLIYKTTYKRVKELGIHPYADEEFMDFFIWMSKHKESPTFMDFFTVD